jgi:CubicO group peptidase (beta-lactamase class C family)
MTKLKGILMVTVLSVCFCIKVSFLHGQTDTTYSKEVEEKIKQVENNLKPWVQTENGVLKYTLQERLKTYCVKGVSIAVISNYKIEWARGYGWADSAKKIPVTRKTMFLAGSNSKSLNAMGVLKLAQDGKVNLYADINDYLKTWKFPYDSKSNGKKITITNLLNHTSGLSVYGTRGYKFGEKIPTLIQILDGKKPANNPAVRSEYEPSLKFGYSGGGTEISQLIVQDVTGMSYDKYMWENVLKPLGMMNSTYTQPPVFINDSLLARGYYSYTPVLGKYHIIPEQAAAGLWSTPTDLAKYVIETELALQGKSQKVLSKEMTELRLIPFDTVNGFGMGFVIEDKSGVKYFDHGGGNEGFLSQFIGSFEDGNGVVVMMNNATGGSLIYEIIRSVAITYNWKNYYTPVIKNEITMSEKDMQKYTGKYRFFYKEGSGISTSLATLLVYKNNDGLWIDSGDDIKYKIHFTDNSHFFLIERQTEEYYFKINSRGKVVGISKNLKGRIVRQQMLEKHFNKIMK